MAKSVTWPQPKWAGASLIEDKIEGRKTHKQAATEGSYSEGLVKHLKGVIVIDCKLFSYNKNCPHIHSYVTFSN